MSKTYTETEVKKIYADLIEQIGCDAGFVCQWSGVDFVSLEVWKNAWNKSLREHEEYLQRIGAHNERKRIAEQLLELNKPKSQEENLEKLNFPLKEK